MPCRGGNRSGERQSASSPNEQTADGSAEEVVHGRRSRQIVFKNKYH